MDLALELGMTVAQIGRMKESELRKWARYARTQVLPTRRLEHYLAQIAFAIARTMGGSKAKSHVDFLMQFTPSEETYEDATAEEHAELLRVIAGGKNARIYADK